MMKCAFVKSGTLLVAVAVGGCAGNAGAPGTPSQAHFAPPLKDAGRERPVLFLGTQNTSVSLYSANIKNPNPPFLGSITQGVTRSNGLWIDRSGTLYVTNQTSPPSVVEYRHGTSSPFKTITSGLYNPDFCAVDAAGNLYVDDDLNGGIVLVYSADGTSPSRTIQLPRIAGHFEPGGLAFDRRGDLLVATFSRGLQETKLYSIAPGSSKLKQLNWQGLPGGNALGSDAAGYVYVGGIEGTIAVYAPGTTTPSRYVNVGESRGQFYSDLTVTPNGTIFWPNNSFDEVYEVAPGASGPTNFFGAQSVGVDAAVGSW